MAGQPLELLTGGSGAYSAPAAAVVAKPSANGSIVGGQQPHHGVIGLVVLAVVVLIVLHLAGFRFTVTAGRR